MEVLEDKSKCCGCHACYNVCPKNAITMIEDEKGFEYPIIDKEKCIECGLCRKVCPVLNSAKVENEPIAYSAYNKDEKIRKESSSGGVFTLLAEEILNRNGVVFGASFDEEFNVHHTYIEDKEELKKFRGSKYVQSSIGNTYRKAKEFLENDRYVLFTGTPCQIEGLKSFLRKEYDKLYTQDIICHGVPSNKIWDKYKQYRKEVDKGAPQKINFRNKDDGWKEYNINFKYENTEYKNNHNKDLYIKAFLQDIVLRDSCYNCSFKKKNRISDITLADFWGIEKVLPEMDDNKGTSLVIVNSKKGKELIEKVKDKMIYKEVNFDDAIQYNPSMTKSVEMNKNREKFFENLDNIEFSKLVKKYTSHNIISKRIIKKIKRIIKGN